MENEQTNLKELSFNEFKSITTKNYIKTPENATLRLKFLKNSMREIVKNVSEKDKLGEYIKVDKTFWEWDVLDLDTNEEKVLSKSSYPFFLALKEFFQSKDKMQDEQVKITKKGSGQNTTWLIEGIIDKS